MPRVHESSRILANIGSARIEHEMAGPHRRASVALLKSLETRVRDAKTGPAQAKGCRANRAVDGTNRRPRVLSPPTRIVIVERGSEHFSVARANLKAPQQFHFLKVDFASCILHSRS
jgi:hypothetical protein